MLAQSPIAGDTRIIREAATLADAGHVVTIVGRAVPPGTVVPPGVHLLSAGVGRFSGPSGLGRGTGLRRRVLRAARWLLLPEHRARVERSWVRGAAHLLAERPGEFDAVHAHDFNTLALAARTARAAGIPYLYDSHELWSGRPRAGRPTPVSRARDRWVEKRLGLGAHAVLTVGEGVARELRNTYGWGHIRVVRNTFPRTAYSPNRPERPTGAAYAGRLAADRELEVIAAASLRTELPLSMLGPRDDTWFASFDPGRARVLPSLPVTEVDDVLAAAGIALVTHSDRWRNHQLAMPNKLFHAVHAGVPVVATDVEELGRIVRRYDLGALYAPGDVDSFLSAVDEVRSRYPHYVAAVEAAGDELSWAEDRAVLLDVYARTPSAGEASILDRARSVLAGRTGRPSRHGGQPST